jgi:DNA-binding GntR family transcriptional regulator
MEERDKPAGRVDEVLRAFSSLRAWILEGELEPGRPISQVELARKLGVSRGPLRESLRLLQNEGLVVHAHNQRARVADISPQDLDHLYAMRIALESLSVVISVPLLSADDVVTLEGLLGSMNEFQKRGDFEAWKKPHREFHAMLIRPAGDRFERECAQLYDHAERYRRIYVAAEPHLWASGAPEHKEMAAAARARDAEGAALAVANHLARAASVLIASMDPGWDLMNVRRALKERRTVAQLASNVTRTTPA